MYTVLSSVLQEMVRYIPGAGWAMATNAYLFLTRRFEYDQAHIETMIDYYAHSGCAYQVFSGSVVLEIFWNSNFILRFLNGFKKFGKITPIDLIVGKTIDASLCLYACILKCETGLSLIRKWKERRKKGVVVCSTTVKLYSAQFIHSSRSIGENSTLLRFVYSFWCH